MTAPVPTQPTMAKIAVWVSGTALRLAMKAATATRSTSLTRKNHFEILGGWSGRLIVLAGGGDAGGGKFVRGAGARLKEKGAPAKTELCPEAWVANLRVRDELLPFSADRARRQWALE